MDVGVKGLDVPSSLLKERRDKMPPDSRIRQAYWLLELNLINDACFELTNTVCQCIVTVLQRLQEMMGVKSLCSSFLFLDHFWQQ